MNITFTNPPIISLTPITPVMGTIIDDPGILLPLSHKIITNLNKIYYDPYRTFERDFPTIQAYYVKYPDLNTDITVQRQIYEDAWKKYRSSWIYDYVKIFKYIKKRGSVYRLVDSLNEGKKAKINNSEIDEKIAWIINNFFVKSDIASTVEKYKRKAEIDIWEVLSDEHIDHFKEFVYHQMKRKLLQEISH